MVATTSFTAAKGAVHAALRNMTLPVISAPMFLVSGPQLVTSVCRQGMVGSFPSLNALTDDILEEWLTDINTTLESAKQSGENVAPYAVNLIVHRTNPRLQKHVELMVKYKVPIVITSLGAVKDVIDAVHSYNGLVFHDVTNLRHAANAVKAGADGLIAVCSGAGGHAGAATPFALIPALRAAFGKDMTIIAAGAIGDGKTVRAAQVLGADYAYMGTKFIATQESMAQQEYKDMLVSAKTGPSPTFLPIIYTNKVSGVNANFIRDSLVAAGLDPDKLANAEHVEEDFSKLDGGRAWRDVWSAGHGIINIHDIPTIKQLADRLKDEYQLAVKEDYARVPAWVNAKL
ncbi:hypothetical protein AMAG_14651 [Allomyces macrogynus ATCC 38327]|uniref:Uncharacterized protein n=1 Tax=Allomyces macrogynus (strain ATCC 38327) TaxID=578462 RepID=A0A0L0T767_ALLM3|nr:hypothetical protein AMAG_14651 [Allomyces macrogynus ATCC 38327]|eukprot:KNE70526.1 hypothetical protein AMAG_14651 [Allomyces macrogynus ATCC 38327]